MQTANDKLADYAVSHAIDLSRYSNGAVRRMMALLNRTDADLFAKLTEALERLPPESFTVQRLDQQLVEVQRLNAEVYREAGEQLDTELLELTGYEASFQHRSIRAAMPKEVRDELTLNQIAPNQVYAAAMARPFQGKLLREWLTDIESARAARIRDSVRMGFVEGETISQMVRRLRGTRANGYADGLLEIDRRGAEAMVRTAVNHTANYARQAVYEANSDLIEEWEFLATLDGRTTITCASLSGKTFKIGQGPQPPRHINCRSTSVPVLASAWAALGVDKADIDKGTQASMDGQVAAEINYSEWLRSKPAAFQDDVLGAERGKLFRSGKISVDRFTDNKGKVYTLEELRKRDAALFESAGL